MTKNNQLIIFGCRHATTRGLWLSVYIHFTYIYIYIIFVVILGSLAAPDGIHYHFFSPVNIHALQLNKPVRKIRFFYRNTQFLFNFEAFWPIRAIFGYTRPVFRLYDAQGLIFLLFLLSYTSLRLQSGIFYSLEDKISLFFINF